MGRGGLARTLGGDIGTPGERAESSSGLAPLETDIAARKAK